MGAAIVTVGDELLRGDRPDTNFALLARRLGERGIQVALHTTVADDEVAIARALKSTQTVAQVVIVTGGLGPTSDDVTRQGIARALGRGLEFNEAVGAHLSDRFSNLDPDRLELILKQAYAVEGAEIIMPNRGTAPGLILVHGDQTIYALPGVPAELEEMLETSVLAHIANRTGSLTPLARRVLRTAGIPEAAVQTLIADLEDTYDTVRLGLLAHPGLVDVVVTAPESAARDFQRVVDEITARLGDALYGEGDVTLAEAAGRLLAQRGKSVAVAESCTGGLLGELITDVAGSSSYFVGGVIAYANDVKQHVLAVDTATLEEEGAVSEESARQMARGVRRCLKADIGVAITGVAGPEGGTRRAPVGTVHIRVLDESGETGILIEQPGSRRQIRERAAHAALNQLRLRLLDT